MANIMDWAKPIHNQSTLYDISFSEAEPKPVMMFTTSFLYFTVRYPKGLQGVSDMEMMLARRCR